MRGRDRRVDRRAHAHTPSDRDSARRRGAVDRRRGRCQISRRVRMQRSARPAVGIHRARGTPTRVVGRPLCPHAWPVHVGRRGHSFRIADRTDRRSAGGARSSRSRGARRVPSGWRGPRVLRRRCAPPASAAVAGDVAPRGRAGRARGLRPVHPGMARHSRRAPRPRFPGRGAGPVARCSAGGVRAGERAAAGAVANLPGGRSRRALHDRRCHLGATPTEPSTGHNITDCSRSCDQTGSCSLRLPIRESATP